MSTCHHCGYPTHTNVTGSCKSCRKSLAVEPVKMPEPVKAPTVKKETKKVKAKKAPVKPITVELGDDATD